MRNKLKWVVKRDAMMIGEALSQEYADPESEAAVLAGMLESVISNLIESDFDWATLSELEGFDKDLLYAISEVSAYRATPEGVPPMEALYDIAAHLIESRTIFGSDCHE